MDDLKRIITPSLLTLLVEARIPFPATAPLDFSEIARQALFADTFAPAIKARAWPALVALSEAGLDALTPDALAEHLLPAAAEAEFPRQCLGLQLLLDQATRALNQGVDCRWTNSYFDVVSQRFAAWWLALPQARRPDSPARWRDELGVSLDYWVCVRLWFSAPFVHSESARNQEIALDFTDATRRAMEEATDTTDPWRERRDEVLADVYGFPRVIREGPPQENDVTWWFMLMDIHKPIIDRFGRYPYSNLARGRESTKEEVEWLDKVDHFAEQSPEVAKQIAEDIKAGRWQPLGAGSSQ